MGDMMLADDIYIPGLLDLLNLRFTAGDAIREMVVVQKQFQVFRPNRSFKDSVRVLNVAGFWNWRARKRWYRLLDNLENLESDRAGENGNARIVAVLIKHLASAKPLPVYFAAHDSRKNKRVLVIERDTPIFYIEQPYLTISLPMRPKKKKP
jgi:hypothetical protein